MAMTRRRSRRGRRMKQDETEHNQERQPFSSKQAPACDYSRPEPCCSMPVHPARVFNAVYCRTFYSCAGDNRDMRRVKFQNVVAEVTSRWLMLKFCVYVLVQYVLYALYVCAPSGAANTSVYETNPSFEHFSESYSV